MCQQYDALDPMINTCNSFCCDQFTPNSYSKPKIWTEYEGGLVNYTPGCRGFVLRQTASVIMEYISDLIMKNVNTVWTPTNKTAESWNLAFHGQTSCRFYSHLSYLHKLAVADSMAIYHLAI